LNQGQGLALLTVVGFALLLAPGTTGQNAGNSSNSSSGVNGTYDCSQYDNVTDAKAACNNAESGGERMCIFRESVAGNKCERYDKCAEEGTDATACAKIDDCEWNGISEACEAADEDDDEDGECQTYDAIKVACGKLTKETKCKAYDDSSGKCSWDNRACVKNQDYDPNSCSDITDEDKCKDKGEPDGNLTLAPGCMWETNVDPNVCKMKTGDVDNDGNAACKNTDNKKDCNAVDDDGNQNCMWVAAGEVDDPNQECREASEKGEAVCNRLVDDAGNKRCNWQKALFGDEKVCADYDYCSEYKKKGSCEKDENCGWENQECAKKSDGNDGGDGNDDDLETCRTQLSKDDCISFDNNNGDDDTGNDSPVCMWTKKKEASCINFDPCRKNRAFNENKELCQSAPQCSWTKESDEEFCALTETTVDQGCNSDSLDEEDACNDYEDGKTCMWFQQTRRECKDYEKCSYEEEDECNNAEEKCYYVKSDQVCYQGVRPTTQTTATTSTVTTGTVTTTTEFNCGRREWQCLSGDQCIAKRYQCDGGTPDCRDGSDEATGHGLCSTTTTTTTIYSCPNEGNGWFMCASGDECILEVGYCDGATDCKDKSDEVDCPTESTTITGTTTTTTTMTTTTTTTTKTTTTTTTTLDACITTQQCSDEREFLDAQHESPLFSTRAQCRACFYKISLEEACDQMKSVGCPEDPTLPPINEAQKNRAVISDWLRVALAEGLDLNDIPTLLALRAGVVETLTFANYSSVRTGDIIDLEFEPVAASEYVRVLVYTKRFANADNIWRETGAFAEDGFAPLTFTMDGTVYDAVLWNEFKFDVDNLDKKGNPMAVTTTVPIVDEGDENDEPLIDLPTGDDDTLYDEDGNLILPEYSDIDLDNVDVGNLDNVDMGEFGSSTSDDDDGSGSGTIIAAVVIVLLLIAGGVIGFMVYRKRQAQKRGPPPSSQKKKQTVSNSAYEGEGVPDWADPDYPFLSRQEAEAQIRTMGGSDGSYVVRQTKGVERGYVITAIMGGVFTNISLKRQGPNLMYGSKKVGQSITEALSALKTKVKVHPKVGKPYLLKSVGVVAAASAAAAPEKAKKKKKKAAAPVKKPAPVAPRAPASSSSGGGYLSVKATDDSDSDEWDPDDNDNDSSAAPATKTIVADDSSDDEWDLDADA